MAGSEELYLQPIIKSAVGNMADNINAMNTQLSETTRILMNILNNQGLEQHQAAYNGAAFSALTLAASSYKSIVPTINTITFTTNSDFSFSVLGGNFSDTNGFKVIESDLTNIDKITIKEKNLRWIQGGYVPPGTTGIVRMILVKDSVEVQSFDLFSMPNNTLLSNEVAEITIPDNLKQKYDYILFKANRSFDLVEFQSINIGDTLVYPYEVPALAFSAANILTYDTSSITSGYLANYNKTVSAYITIPDIQGLATWVSTILKGNLEGVSVALVDNTTHDLIKVLPTATSDISDVQELSGLALLVTFAGDGNALKYMSGFTMRYY